MTYYKHYIDMIKGASNALFVAFLAQIANLFYTDGDFLTTIYLYIGLVLTFIVWISSFILVKFFDKKGAAK